MHVAYAILFVSLVATTLGQRCAPRPKPHYNCANIPKKGVFIPHPSDCTFLVMCLAYQPIVVSLCEENARSGPDYTLGCPRKCAMLAPNCYGTIEPPHSSVTQPTHNPTSTTRPTSVSQATNRPPPVISTSTTHLPLPSHSTTHPSSPSSPVSNTPITVPAKPTTGTEITGSNPYCDRGGIFSFSDDCRKALICPSGGIEGIVFSICDNVAVDSSFPVGCPEKCPNWVSGIEAIPKVAVL